MVELFDLGCIEDGSGYEWVTWAGSPVYLAPGRAESETSYDWGVHDSYQAPEQTDDEFLGGLIERRRRRRR